MFITAEEKKQNIINFSDKLKTAFYEKGSILPTQRPGLWLISSGIIQLETVHENGTKVVLGWEKPGRFVGMGCTEEISAISNSDVLAEWYSPVQIEHSPSLRKKILLQSASRIQQSQSLLAIAGLRRVEDRLLKLLALLVKEFGINTSIGVKLNIRLTHQNIAHTINTTRVTVTRLLGEFQDKGYIEIDRDRHINLLNLSAYDKG